MKEVEIMISSLKNHPYAQCYVSIDPNVGIHFYSYKTLVIYIDKSGWLRCTGTYSRQPAVKSVGFCVSMPQ